MIPDDTRWGLHRDDVRLRLALALEAWAPGGIECNDLTEMDMLLEFLDAQGLALAPVEAGRLRFLDRKGGHLLQLRMGQDWPFTCSCQRWASAGDHGDVPTVRKAWETHVTEADRPW